MRTTKQTTKTAFNAMLSLMAGALAFSACSNYDDLIIGENGSSSSRIVTLTAWQEGAGSETRAAVDGTSINWQAGDQIKVFGADEAKAYTTNSGGATSATFTGEEVNSAAYALYPYQDDATISGSVITAEVPMTQTAVPDSFDPKAALMVGTVDSDGKVTFKNVMSYVKVKVPSNMPQCRQITVKAKNEWITLAGKVKITVAAEPSWAETPVKEGQAFVRLVPPASSDPSEIAYLKPGKTYYIAVLPQTMNYGFEVIYNLNDDIYCHQTTSETPVHKKFYRNKVKDIGQLSSIIGYYTYRVEKLAPNPRPVGAPYAMATFNIGATTSDKSSTASHGDYFALGALRPAYTRKPASGYTFTNLYRNSGFTIANAPYYNGSQYTKYHNTGETLDPTDDIAAMLWGGSWRMSTKTETEAMSSISEFYSKMPLAGFCDGTSLKKVDESFPPEKFSFYWSSSAYGNFGAYSIMAGTASPVTAGNSRESGYSIRPVLDQN